MEVFLKAAQITLPVFALIAAGWAYARRRPVDLQSANRVNLDFFLPALLFYGLAAAPSSLLDLAPLALGGALIVLGSGLVAHPICRWLRLPAAATPPMMFTNYGNMGLPLIVFAFGEEALPAAVILFLTGNALHLIIGLKIQSGAKVMWREVLLSPMLVASGAALLLRGLNIPTPAIVLETAKLAGGAAVPLLLFALGARISAQRLSFNWRAAVAPALLCPASGMVCWLVFAPLLPLSETHRAILTLFAVLPPALLNYVFAERFASSPALVANIVLTGNLAAMFVIPAALIFILR